MENSGRKKSAKKARSDNEVSKKLFKVGALRHNIWATTLHHALCVCVHLRVHLCVYVCLCVRVLHVPQFQCFAERLANIRINVTHRVGSITDTPEVNTDISTQSLVYPSS